MLCCVVLCCVVLCCVVLWEGLVASDDVGSGIPSNLLWWLMAVVRVPACPVERSVRPNTVLTDVMWCVLWQDSLHYDDPDLKWLPEMPVILVLSQLVVTLVLSANIPSKGTPAM